MVDTGYNIRQPLFSYINPTALGVLLLFGFVKGFFVFAIMFCISSCPGSVVDPAGAEEISLTTLWDI